MINSLAMCDVANHMNHHSIHNESNYVAHSTYGCLPKTCGTQQGEESMCNMWKILTPLTFEYFWFCFIMILPHLALLWSWLKLMMLLVYGASAWEVWYWFFQNLHNCVIRRPTFIKVLPKWFAKDIVVQFRSFFFPDLYRLYMQSIAKCYCWGCNLGVLLQYCSVLQSVIAWLESMTWLDSSHDFWWLGFDLSHVERNGDSARVTFFTEWLDSSHSQWLETRVRVIFTKCLSSWWTYPVRLHGKKWGFFASVMIKIGGNFLFWLSSCDVLHLGIKCSQLA